MNSNFLTIEIPHLFPFLEGILQDGGKRIYGQEFETSTFNFVDGLSGFHYQNNDIQASIGLGILFGGIGYVVKRHLKDSEKNIERFDYFDPSGNFTFSSDKKVLEPLYVDTFEMDLSCPIINHFYNFLSVEYKQAAEGKSKTTAQITHVEKFLQHLYQLKKIIYLPIRNGTHDSAIEAIYRKILKAEMDPVLTWNERQIVFAQYRERLNHIIATKARAHKISKSRLQLSLTRKNLKNFYERFMSRPQNNAKGLFYKYTIGKVIWFFSTVKSNLGYSIALAVYGPFTYYFITMPMNPHAMQAVGRVRSVYLTVKEEMSDILLLVNNQNKNANIAITNTPTVIDTVITTNAAPTITSINGQVLANVIYPSQIATYDAKEMKVEISGSSETVKTQFLNMLLTTDIPKVDQISWTDRMSNFKQMQIAYEENIEYASRMGRLEQLETQYNFPMQIESTWEEMERYNNLIFKLRTENPNLSAKLKQYLSNEVNRTQQLELYLWDRLGRFILDQIYVMLDQDQEQKRNDYYVGRAFVFMQEMTNVLSWRYKDFKKHEGYERIQELANFYNNSRKEFGSVMNNMKGNSDLFKQRNVFDTKEFRAQIKRQWEILFLQNSKAEEASNMGLNMYIWSVRNTAWALQSIYSAKKEELGLIVKRDLSGNMFSPEDLFARNKISMLYETFIHNLTLEYVGIREEMMKRLGKDIESAQRMIVIDNLKEFLSDREKLDGTVMSNTTNNSEKQL